MTKTPIIKTIDPGFGMLSSINENFEALKEGFENTLSRDGSTPNAMNADLDMDSNDIINAGVVSVDKILVKGKEIVLDLDLSEAISILNQATTMVKYTLVAEEGQTELLKDHTGADIFAYSGTAHIEIDAFGSLTPKTDYTINEEYRISLTEPLLKDQIVRVTVFPRFTNSEAQTLVTETLEARDEAVAAALDAASAATDAVTEVVTEAVGSSPQSWADFVNFLPYQDGKVVSFNGVQFVRDRSANITGLPTGAGWEPFGRVTPEHFGALGGATNDAVAFQRAVDYSASVGVQMQVDKLLKVNTTINIPSNLDLRFGAKGGIDYSTALLSSFMFYAAGTFSNLTNLAVNAEMGAEFITVANASAFAVDDLIRIRSEETWGAGSGGVPSGEMHYIASINGNVIGLRDRLYYGYALADAAAIEKVNTVKNITIDGGLFIGAGPRPISNQRCMGFHACENLRIRNNKTFRFGLHNIEIGNSVKVYVTGNELGHILQADQNSYGVTLFNATQWVTISNNHFAMCRGGVSSGGSSGSYGQVRNVAVTGNTFYGILGGAVRSHRGAENWTITGNSIQAGEDTIRPGNEGILFRGVSCTISGNSIYNISGRAIRIAAQAVGNTRKTNAAISGNVIVNCGRQGIVVETDAEVPGAEINGISITGNTIKNWGTYIAIAAIDIDAGGGNISNISITGNTATEPNRANCRGISIRSRTNKVASGTITGNTVESFGNETIMLTQDEGGTCGNFAISGNRAFGGTYGIRSVGSSLKNYVSGNVVSGSAGGLLGFAADEMGGNIVVA